MNVLQPFFLLISRASVVWLGILAFGVISIIIMGLSQPDEIFAGYVDIAFASSFLFPAGAGWLAGSVIQEFQHSTFAMFLPAVRSRLAMGFVITGLVVATVVIGLAGLVSTAPHNHLVLFAIGIGTYCLFSILIHPKSVWMSALVVILILWSIVNSDDLQRMSREHPLLTISLSIGLCAACVLQLFARSTFRKIPFGSASSLPGRFSFEKSRRQQRRLMSQHGPVKPSWKVNDYLGNDAWLWSRAAIYETYGAHTARSIVKTITNAWGLGLLVVLGAWLDKDEMRFSEALARSINDALLRSPFQPEFGDHGGPYPLVMIVIAITGVMTALFKAVSLRDDMPYPLSRLQRAAVQFRGGLIDMAIFLLIIAPCLLMIGFATGLSVGYEIRFDFVPFFFRVLLLTLIVMPIAYWGRLQLQEATWRKAENNTVAVGLGIVGFVILVSCMTGLFNVVFDSPVMELGFLTVAILISRLMYWRSLLKFYSTADLA